MKIQFQEYPHGVEFSLVPETTEELAKLARFAKNAKAKKPHVFLSFSTNPYMSVWIEKISPKKQINRIEP